MDFLYNRSLDLCLFVCFHGNKHGYTEKLRYMEDWQQIDTVGLFIRTKTNEILPTRFINMGYEQESSSKNLPRFEHFATFDKNLINHLNFLFKK